MIRIHSRFAGDRREGRPLRRCNNRWRFALRFPPRGEGSGVFSPLSNGARATAACARWAPVTPIPLGWCPIKQNYRLLLLFLPKTSLAPSVSLQKNQNRRDPKRTEFDVSDLVIGKQQVPPRSVCKRSSRAGERLVKSKSKCQDSPFSLCHSSKQALQPSTVELKKIPTSSWFCFQLIPGVSFSLY